MIELHRGAGMLVPAFGILAALLMNVVTAEVFDYTYYQDHAWPKLTVLLIAGMSCLVVGIYLKKKRMRDGRREQERMRSLDPKFDAINKLAFAGPRDHLMFIPVQYWSIVYFIAAIIYAIKS